MLLKIVTTQRIMNISISGTECLSVIPFFPAGKGKEEKERRERRDQKLKNVRGNGSVPGDTFHTHTLS